MKRNIFKTTIIITAAERVAAYRIKTVAGLENGDIFALGIKRANELEKQGKLEEARVSRDA